MIFFRVQPKGRTIKHRSETSAGELADGLHVFMYVYEVIAASGYNTDEGPNEVVIIEAGTSWDNEDVEGVTIDPWDEGTRVVRRMSFRSFCRDLLKKGLGQYGESDDNVNWDDVRDLA